MDPAGQGQWLRALRRQSWVQDARVDARRNVMSVGRLVALYAEWDTLESRPTWARLIARSGLSERTVARWLQELRVRGWLAHLEHGSTPTTRPMSLAGLQGNRAALYGLRIPLTPEEALAQAGEELVAALVGMLDDTSANGTAEAVPDVPTTIPETRTDQRKSDLLGDKNGSLPLTVSRSCSSSEAGFSRARKPVDNSPKSTSAQVTATTTALRAGFEEERFPDLSIMVPLSRYQMLACADWLREQLPVFGRCSRKLVRHLCKPYWQAGWCGRDIVHAMDHRPSVFDQPARVLLCPDHLASPAQFIRSRLAAWRTGDGAIVAGYWAAKVADADDAHTARARVADRHGRAGASLLRAGERTLTPERIAEHGRSARAQIRPRGAQTAVYTSTASRSPQGAEADLRRAQLVEEARAELARRAAQSAATNVGAGAGPYVSATPPPTVPTPTHPVPTDGTAYERARVRAHAEHGRGTRRRRRPRNTR